MKWRFSARASLRIATGSENSYCFALFFAITQTALSGFTDIYF